MMTEGKTLSGVELLRCTARTIRSNIPAGENIPLRLICDAIEFTGENDHMITPGIFDRVIRVRPYRRIPYKTPAIVFTIDLYIGMKYFGPVYALEACPVCGDFMQRGNTVCDACYTKYTVECPECGERILLEELDEFFSGYPDRRYVRINGRERLICSSCYSDPDKFRRCDCCGTIAPRDEIWRNRNADHLCYCRECRESSIVNCDYCGDYFPAADLHDNGSHVECISCRNRRIENERMKAIKKARIRNYGDKPVYELKTLKPTMDFFGTEIEATEGKITDELLIKLAETEGKYWNYSHDGSLSLRADDGEFIRDPNNPGHYLNPGIETVTHAMSLEYHKTMVPYSDLFNTLKSAGYTAHDNPYCGLHVHISKTSFGAGVKSQKNAISHLIFLIEKFKKEFKIFSRRRAMKWNNTPYEYCQFLTDEKQIYDEFTPENVYNAFVAINLKEDRYSAIERRQNPSREIEYEHSGRYYAINLQNKNTVELRFFKGTLNLNTYFAALEMCQYLVNYVRKHKKSDHYLTLSWEQFTAEIPSEFNNLKDYMRKKKLIA